MSRRALHLWVIATMLLASIGVARADTIPMQATALNGRTVSVSWTLPATGEATLYRQYPGAAQAESIAVVQGAGYTDRLARCVCGDTVRYRLVQGSDSGAVAVFVEDNEPTAPAEWGVVTVDEATQAIVLHWIPSIDTDIVGYLVCEGMPSMAIDTVFGQLSDTYSPAGYAVTTSYQFRICAFDSCRQTSPLTEICNNLVATCSAPQCSREVAVAWNGYQHMPGGMGHYEVWRSEDSGPMQLAVQVDDTTARAATFTASSSAQSVRVMVKAVSGDASTVACSNIASFDFDDGERPEYLYLRKVSSSDDGTAVVITAQTDPAFPATDYTVYRSVDDAPGTVAATCRPQAGGVLQWTDRTARPLQSRYTYWLAVTDGCGVNKLVSQKGSTLKPALAVEGERLTLDWTAYEGWQGSPSYTVLLRRGGEGAWEEAGGTTGLTLSFEAGDGQSSLAEYKIVAAEPAESQWHRGDTLQSAVVAHRPLTTLWVANAFTPAESQNNTFGPVATYLNPVDYLFCIYDRRGVLLFSATEPSAVWDGTSRGHAMPQGAYVYRIQYTQSDGTSQVKTGTVLLIR